MDASLCISRWEARCKLAPAEVGEKLGLLETSPSGSFRA